MALNHLTLKPGARPAVSAEMENLTDVSELILLELRADFYDARGQLLGSGTASYADEEFADNGATPVPHGNGVHGESLAVVIVSAKPLGEANSAVVTVPQLVNE